MHYTSLQLLPAYVVELAEPHYQGGKGGDMQTINELFATSVKKYSNHPALLESVEGLWYACH